MPKINREEYEVLKEFQKMGAEWLARDADGLLYYHNRKPYKLDDSSDMVWDSNSFPMDIVDVNFQFIQWEDENPYNIAELIEEYESEETEVKKNIEWLKREIYKELESWQGVEGGIDEG